MARVGLATKITVPFVALFMALLISLGVVLAREILQEIESRVEREQRFVLFVATFPYFQPKLDVTFLRGLRDASRGSAADAVEIELAVMEERAAPISTLDPQKEDEAATLKELQEAVKDSRLFPGLSGVEAAERVLTTRITLREHSFLVLYASRWPAGKRRDFFLLYPQEGIAAAQHRALYRIAGLGALGLLCAALIGRLVAQWISRPVRRLAAAAGRLAAGGLSERLEPDMEAASDEIGELSRAFRSMVESLRRSQTELVKAERLAATGKLAASVAHEIRNPLTSLRMTVQMLAEKSAQRGDPAEREAYAVVLGEIERLALTVEELLTFARPRPAQRVPTDLNRLIAETVAFLGRQLQHAHVEVNVEAAGGADALPPDLPLDPNKVRQLLVNLILNAMQAIIRNGTVTLRTRWDGARKRACLEVADTGPGISAEVRERIFEPFVSTKAGGGGLGLAIAKQVVDEHEGTIVFETSNAGTTFRIELDCATQVGSPPRSAAESG